MGTHYRRMGKPLSKPFTPGPMMKEAKKLHGSLAGRPMIVMGNSYSLNYLDMKLVQHFITIGCNRCLRPDNHAGFLPDYYSCVDRDPYAQVVDLLREYKGIRILSKMLFDPNNLHKKTRVRTHWAPLQPYPDFEWYGFRPVSSGRPRQNSHYVYTTWPDRDACLRIGVIPVYGMDLGLLIPGAANVGYSMFQIAGALGANPIGIVGIDLSWESNTKSHAFGDGNGKAAGAFSLNPKFTLPFFKAGYDSARRNGIEVYNLSTKGILSPTIPRMRLEEFHRRFGRFARGKSLYTRQQRQSKKYQPRRLGKRPKRADHRRQQIAPSVLTELSTGGGQAGSPRGIGQVARRKAEAARIARARREARRKRNAGGD